MGYQRGGYMISEGGASYDGRDMTIALVRRSQEESVPPLTFHDGVVAAPVQEDADRLLSAAVDLVSLTIHRHQGRKKTTTTTTTWVVGRLVRKPSEFWKNHDRTRGQRITPSLQICIIYTWYEFGGSCFLSHRSCFFCHFFFRSCFIFLSFFFQVVSGLCPPRSTIVRHLPYETKRGDAHVHVHELLIDESPRSHTAVVFYFYSPPAIFTTLGGTIRTIHTSI